MAVIPLFYWGMACALVLVANEHRKACAWALAALVCLLLFSATRQRLLDQYRKDPLREAVQALSEHSLSEHGVPAVVLAYPLALWYYKTDSSACIPVAGWPDAKAFRWQSTHDLYYILIHRADKVDPGGVWSRELDSSIAAEIWKDGNARIFRVHKNTSGKEF
jgi:hypothetical protein